MSVLSPGEEIAGCYRVMELLGRGSFATAYRCEDRDGGDQVVVKLFNRHLER